MNTIKQARYLFGKGDHESAKRICLELIAKSQDLANAYFLLGGIELQTGVTESAIDLLKLATESDAHHSDAATLLALLFMDQKSWEEAEKLLNSVIAYESNPRSLHIALMGLLLCLGNLGRYDETLVPAKRLRDIVNAPEGAFLSKGEFADALRYVALVLRDIGLANKLLIIKGWNKPQSSTAIVTDYMDTQSWCAANGVRFDVLEESSEMLVPCGSGGLDEWNYKSDRIFLAQIPGGGYVPFWDFAVAPDGIVLSDSGYIPVTEPASIPTHIVDEKLTRSTIFRPSPAKTKVMDVDAVFLSSPRDFHPGHWMVDFLPRLQIRKHVQQKGLKYAVPATLPQRLKDFLKYFDFDENDLVFCDKETFYVFRNLYIFQPGSSTKPNPGNVKFLWKQLGGKADTRCKSAGRYFLTREAARTRLIKNDTEFQKVLNKYGFKTVDIGILSIDDQVKMLSEAEIFVGSIGSNLMAFFYAKQGTRMIELTPGPHQDNVIALSSRFAGIRHEYFLCEVVHTAGAKRRPSMDFDLIVDCEKLDRLLQTYLPV